MFKSIFRKKRDVSTNSTTVNQMKAAEQIIGNSQVVDSGEKVTQQSRASRPVAEKGVDVYIFFDCSMKQVYYENGDWGQTVLGRTFEVGRNTAEDIGFWMAQSFSELTWALVQEMDEEKDRASVFLYDGSECQEVCPMTNNIGRLSRCIDPDTFYVFNSYGVRSYDGDILFGEPNAWYKEMYQRVCKSMEEYPERMIFGVFLVQNTDIVLEEHEWYQKCADIGIAMVTLGAKDKKVRYKKTVDESVIKSHSNIEAFAGTETTHIGLEEKMGWIGRTVALMGTEEDDE